MMYNHLETLRALQDLVFGNTVTPAANNNPAPVDKLQQFINTPPEERQGIVGIPSAQSALNAGFGLGTPVGGFPEKKPEPVSLINTSQQLKYDAPLPTGLDSSQQSAIDAGFSGAGESQFDVTGSTLPTPLNTGGGNTMQALASAGQLAKALDAEPLQPVFTSPTVRAYQPVANPYAAMDMMERPRLGLKLSNL